jgi:UDP:flavonoid glycosyltransferase YjiC (YdhE family)
MCAERHVLLASELGGNLGHIGPLTVIAKALRSEGMRCLLAVPDVAVPQLVGTSSPVIPSPRWEGIEHEGAAFGNESYLDLLVQAGFSDKRLLRGVLSAWGAILELFSPSVIVADHAPALSFLAEARGLPIVHVSTGFALPPIHGGQFASLRPGRAPLVPEPRLRAGLEEALAAMGHGAPPSLTSAFQRGKRIICSIRELDPYGAAREEPGFLPIEDMPKLVLPPTDGRVFAYLDGRAPGVMGFVQALIGVDRPITAYIRNATAFMNEFLRLRGHEALVDPAPLADVLPLCSHVVSHGGSTLCHAALCAGRPHLLWPLHDEARLNLALLARLGCGVQLDPKRNAADKNALLRILCDHALIEAAQRQGGIISERKPQRALTPALAAVRVSAGSE